MIKLLTILLLLPCLLQAQIGASRPVAGTASTSNAATYAGASFTPTANALLVVFVYAAGTVLATPTMTNTGTTLTWVRKSAQIIGANGNYIFYAKVPASVSASVITFNCTGDNATGSVITVMQFTGYDAVTSDPIKQVKLSTATTTSTNPTITFDAALGTANGYGVAWAAGLTANASTAISGWTEADDLAFATPSANMASAYRAGGETTAGAFTFTAASSTWQVMGVEVYVSGAGPTATNRGIPIHLLQ